MVTIVGEYESYSNIPTITNIDPGKPAAEVSQT